MRTWSITPADLAARVGDLVAAGVRVLAPVPTRDARGAEYAPIARLEEACLGPAPDGGHGPLPRRSLKELFLPATEVLLRWKATKGEVVLEEVPTTFAPTVVLGARPCDAAGVDVLDGVMGWDPRDELWFGRRAATTIVTLACPGVDDACFCSAVGLSPDATRGSDVLLVPVDGGFLAEAVTAKGEAFLDRRRSAEASGEAHDAAAASRSAAAERVARNLAALPASFAGWLGASFDHAVWKGIAHRCHGCGACAAVCPTCHCFDIVDEPEGLDRGARRRSWDACATCKFTVHASGHNPRESQDERFRQRVMHKFSIYPKRFDAILCTGCGRCVRACPSGMDLPEVLGQLAATQRGAAP